MFIMPVPQQAPAPTAKSRELGRRIDEVVRDFKRGHPDVTDDEVRSALLHSAPPASGPDSAKLQRVAGALVASAVAVAFGLMAVTGGGSRRLDGTAWTYIGVAAGAVGLAFALIRIARRN